MALSRNYILSLSSAVLLFSLTFLPHESGGIKSSSSSSSSSSSILEDEKQRKMILGSKPPVCVNKCSSCRPCRATLVIPPHKKLVEKGNFVKSSYRDRDDDTYYLLSWKCKCGRSLYQP